MSETLSKNTSVERIIAKIDNDFNPDTSDWIPRVGAWCIDAMSQLDALRTKRKRKKVKVDNRIAYMDCPLSGENLKVYDENGCLIKEAEVVNGGGCCGRGNPSTGSGEESVSAGSAGFADAEDAMNDNAEDADDGNIVRPVTPDTVDLVNTGEETAPNVHAETVNDKYPYRYNYRYYHPYGRNGGCEKNYVVVDDCKLELNFDAKFIYVEMDYVETVCSDKFGCELPVIPNNGILVEAIAYYCIYKMLCRGYKHPVFTLALTKAAMTSGINPYLIWKELKQEAKRNMAMGNIDEASKLFRSNLFIETFDSRY